MTVNMKKSNQYIYKLTFSLFLICGLWSCKRLEEMPIPEGKAIPFEEQYKPWREVVAADQELSYFWTVLRRSNLEKTLKNLPALTIFAPKNEAFVAAGYTFERLQSIPVSEVDYILFYLFNPKQIFPEDLIEEEMAISLPSLHKMVGFLEYYRPDPLDYYLRHAITVLDGIIYIDGRKQTPLSEIKIGRGATIIPTNTLIRTPRKDSRQTLLEDPRFSIFMKVRLHNDSIYNDILGVRQTYTYKTNYDNRYVLAQSNAPYQIPVTDYLSAENYTYNSSKKEFVKNNNLRVSTIFAPTNEAFKQAGFATADDFIRLNDRAKPQVSPFFNHAITRLLPTDSILMHHMWGVHTARTSTFFTPTEYLELRPNYPTLYFSNDLEKVDRINYSPTITISPLTGNQYRNASQLRFIKNDKSVTVNLSNSGSPAANIIEADIATLNGVIHAVDKLLIPYGFILK